MIQSAKASPGPRMTAAAGRSSGWVIAATILFGLAIWGITLFSVGRQVGHPFAGFLYSQDRVVSGFTPRDFTGWQAGLRPRDFIVSVDGQPWREMPRLVREAGVGRTLVYTVERGGQTIDVTVPTMEFTPAMVWRFLPGYLVSSLIYLAVGVFVYVQNPTGRLNRYLLAYLTVWAVGMAIIWECYLSQLKLLTYLLIPYAVTAPVAGWVFLWSFPLDEARRSFLSRRPLIKGFLITGAASIIAMMTVRVLADVLDRPDLTRLLAWLEAWPYFIVFGLSSIFFKLAPVVQIALRNRTRLIRQQAGTLLVGLILGISGWFLFFWTPAAIHTVPPGNVQLGGLIPVFYPLSIGYAVLRYRLLDIRVVVRKGLVYSLLTAALTAVFLVLSLSCGYLVQRLTGRTTLLTMLFPALLVAFLFQPAREAVQAFVDRAFFRRGLEARQTLAAFGQGLSTLHECEEVVRLVRTTVAETLGAKEVGLWLLRDDRFVPATGGSEQVLLTRGPLAQGLAAEGKPVRPLPEDISPAAEELRGVGADLAVPLVFGRNLLGILTLAGRRSGEPYGDEDLELLTTLAPSAALALENALLHEERLTMLRERFTQAAEVQEEERRRIARELHDGVGPSLASLRIRLRTVHKLLARERNPLAGEVAELAEQAQDNIRDVRRLIYDLRPAVLDELGLIPALREYIARYQEDQAVEVVLTVPGGPLDLPEALETTLFRITQEALTNVAKHAGARRVEVALTQEDGAVVLLVSDDGQGFEPQSAGPGTGLGLWSMQKRVEQYGGTFEVRSQPGLGTHLTMTIPEGGGSHG